MIEQVILDGIDEDQRAFILRMKPHRRPQVISKADWDAIEPCVDVGGDAWSDTYWFGGMRTTWPVNGKRAKRTFCFNEVGLNVRNTLAQRTRR